MYSNKRSVSKPNDERRITIVKSNLSEEEAFKLEIKLIKKYGRKDNNTGILRNMTDGGEGISGTRFKRKPFTDEHRRKLSEAKKGRKLTDEHKKNIGKESRSRKRRSFTPEERKRMSEAQKGRTVKHKGKKYYRDPNTGKGNYFNDSDDVPSAWVHGTGKRK